MFPYLWLWKLAPTTLGKIITPEKVREMIKGQGCSTSGDAVDALSNEVNRIIKKAVERTKANGRKTVRSHDFVV